MIGTVKIQSPKILNKKILRNHNYIKLKISVWNGTSVYHVMYSHVDWCAATKPKRGHIMETTMVGFGWAVGDYLSVPKLYCSQNPIAVEQPRSYYSEKVMLYVFRRWMSSIFIILFMIYGPLLCTFLMFLAIDNWAPESCLQG